jgi:hypothetical protein
MKTSYPTYILCYIQLLHLVNNPFTPGFILYVQGLIKKFDEWHHCNRLYGHMYMCVCVCVCVLEESTLKGINDEIAIQSFTKFFIKPCTLFYPMDLTDWLVWNMIRISLISAHTIPFNYLPHYHHLK